MKSAANPAIALILVTLICSVSIGTIVGTHLGRTHSTIEPTTLTLVDPNNFAGPPHQAILSAGGFTGFGSLGIPGEVIASGTLIVSEQDENGGGTLVFREGGRETSIHYRDRSKIRRIVTGANLFEGATVLLHLDEGITVGMLHVVSEHLHRGSESP